MPLAHLVSIRHWAGTEAPRSRNIVTGDKGRQDDPAELSLLRMDWHCEEAVGNAESSECADRAGLGRNVVD